MAFRDWTLLLVLSAGAGVAGPAFAQVLEPNEIKFSNERLEAGIYPAEPVADVPSESGDLPFHLDWSLGLKGSYTSSSTEGGSFSTTLNPAFSAVHDGRRVDVTLDGDAEITRPWDGSGEIGVTALRLGLSGTALLDRDTQISGNAALRLEQPLSSTPGLNPVILTPPQVLTGSAGLGVDRTFGKVNIGLKGNLERTIYGETNRADTGLTDNSSQNLWQADASLRAGIQVTPILEVFGEGSLGRDMFDVAAPGGVLADATSRALRGGIAGRWNGVWTASASLGVGYHDFDDASLSDITTRLYDASITYSPDPTLNLTASLSTNIEPAGADANGTARVSHSVAANVAYNVNSWLRLRASADWGLSTLEGSGETERRNGIGAGADYVINRHTALTADYNYVHRDNSTTGILDTHTVGLGITIRR